jgi:DHA1 family multidrug/chloramphenicol efflux transport protein-like MFS transporter
MIAWITTGPFLLIERFHYKPVIFGLIQVIVFGAFIVGTRLVKVLMKKLSLAQIIKVGFSFASVGALYAIIKAVLWRSELYHLIIGMTLFSIGTAFIEPIVNRLNIESSEEPMGSRVAILSCCNGLAGVIGSVAISVAGNTQLLSLASVLVIFIVAGLICYYIAQKP